MTVRIKGQDGAKFAGAPGLGRARPSPISALRLRDGGAVSKPGDLVSVGLSYSGLRGDLVLTLDFE